MKLNIIKNRGTIILRACALSLLLLYPIVFDSCNEDEFLREVPLDFYSPENSFVTYKDFTAAVMNLYGRYRADFWDDSSSGGIYSYWTFTDLVHGTSTSGLINYAGNLQPTSGSVYDYFWRPAYHLIYDANTVIERSDAPDSELTGEIG